jgi:DNA-directed RNA polymerase alpha subunit
MQTIQITTLATTNAALGSLLEPCVQFIFGDISLWTALRLLEEKMKTMDVPAPRCDASRGTPIECLSLGKRLTGLLKREGITTAEEIAQGGPDSLLRIHGMGPGGIALIKSALKEAGLQLAEGEAWTLNQ